MYTVYVVLFVGSYLSAVHKRRPQNSGIFYPFPMSTYVHFCLAPPLVDIHSLWSHLNTVALSSDTSI